MKREIDSRAYVVLKTFLNRIGPEKREALERFLPPSEREKLASIRSSNEPVPFSNENLLDKVHWSWLLPTLKTYTERESKLFLAALNPKSAKNLTKALTLSSQPQEISEVAKAFLRKTLLDSLIESGQAILPIPYLPPSPLNPLLNLSKKQLTHLIERLSLHDLVLELRQIVETKILKKIYSLLTEEEKSFLKHISQHKDPFTLGKTSLEKWDGSEESLRTLLHKRGLVRFGAGLSGQDPDLIWMICHELDIGRGSALHKLCLKEPIQGITDRVIKQIEEIL